MPTLKDFSHLFDWPWEIVAEAVWKRHPNVARFSERKNVDVDKYVGEKRIVDTKAKISREVTYNYSELAASVFQVFLIHGAIGNGADIKMREDLEFNWAQRELTVLAKFTTSNDEIQYTEKCVYKANPDNKQTLVRQSGSSLGLRASSARFLQKILSDPSTWCSFDIFIQL
jgi:hypothetical protein